MAIPQPFLTLTDLEGRVSPEQIDEARSAMDALSVNGYHFDRNGRIEAGIRPVPSSGHSPGYASIAKKGSRIRPDCRKHGRGAWCIHTLILALHQIGVQPEYKVQAPKPNPSKKRSQLSLQVTFDKAGFFFAVLDRHSGLLQPDPGRILKQHPQTLYLLPEIASELLEVSSQEPGERILRVNRLDVCDVLQRLKRVSDPGFRLSGPTGEPITWEDLIPQAPTLLVSWSPPGFSWTWTGKITPQQGDHWLPGNPGFCLRGNTLITFPHLQDLGAVYDQTKGSGTISDHSELLDILFRARHQVKWSPEKPPVLSESSGIELCLSPQNHRLKVEIGLLHRNSFVALPSLQQPVQSTPSGQIVCLSSRFRQNVKKTIRSLGLVPEQTSWTLPGERGETFLKETVFPDSWQITRRDADEWFGIEESVCKTDWNPDGKPTYLLGDENYSHSILMDYLMESKRGIRLPSGQIIHFNTEDLLRNEEILQSLDRACDTELQRKGLLARILGQPSEATITVPARWKKTLRAYQFQGVEWLLSLKNSGLSALLADDMGLGKTIQTLAFLEATLKDLPHLIVMPKTLLWNWKAEIEKFCPRQAFIIHHGSNRTRDPEVLQKPVIVLTTYGTVLKDEDLFYDVHFETVVLDESQQIKNPDAKTTQAVFDLWSETKLALTGTPIENNLEELWSVFQFLLPDYLGPRRPFRGSITPQSTFFQSVKTRVQPLMLRRMKQQVVNELPPKQEITVKIPLGEKQRHIYDSLLSQSKSQIQAGESLQVPSLLTLLLRLRQVCCHPGLVSDLHLSTESSKFEFLLEALRDLHQEGNAALVFSQFTSLLKLFQYQLEEQEIPYLYLDGSTRNREDLVRRYQDGEASVFLISLKAGGTGLNLTRASYVYHLDPWWNPMVEAQATDRTHRIGQTEKVFSYKIIAENSVEEAIQKLQQQKKELAQGLWDYDGQTIPQNLNQQEIVELIQSL